MNTEFKKPNIENLPGGPDNEELLREVIPGESGGLPARSQEGDRRPIEPYELPKDGQPGASTEVHEEIPGHPIKTTLTEKEARATINQMLSGKYDDFSEMTEFLSNQIEGQEE